MNRRRFLAAAAAAPWLPLLAARGASAADATVTSPDGLRLRADPSSSGTVLDVLPAGAAVSVTGAAVGDWVPVQSASGSGWVASAYLSSGGSAAADDGSGAQGQTGAPGAPAQPAPQPASAPASPAAQPAPAPPPAAPPAPASAAPALVVGGTAEATDAVRVRGGPSTEDTVVGGLGAGAVVELLGKSGDGAWWRVAGSVVGYVSGDFLRPRAEPASSGVFDVDLPLPYHRQLTPIWCDPADIEMWREYRTGQPAPSSQAFQQGVWDWELAHNAGFTQEQWDCSPYAVASALDHWMPGRGFDHFVYDDAAAATRCMAFLTAHANYKEPSVANIWRGDHYILVRGVRAAGDPSKDPNARILGLWVADPNKGRPSWLGQDRFIPLGEWLGEHFTPVTYLTPGSGVPGDPWQNKYVTMQRNTRQAGPSAAGRRNATPADYA